VPQFMVERYVSGMTKESVVSSVSRTREQASRMTREGSAVAYIHSAFVPSEEYMVCVFEASSVRLVWEVNDRAGFAFDRVVEVIVVE